jgi:hypothetical protein
MHLVRVSRSTAMGTDLEAALTEALASIPAGYLPRVLLLSDGNENQGSAARAMAGLQRLHVPVDVVPLAGRSLTNLTISSVALPSNAYEGEQIPITLTIESYRSSAHASCIFRKTPQVRTPICWRHSRAQSSM